MRALGLRGRTALAVVVTAVTACLTLTVATTIWAAGMHQENLDRQVTDASARDLEALRDALRVDPDARTLEQLVAAGWASRDRLGTDAVMVRLDVAQPDRPPAADAIPYSFNNFEEPLSQVRPECLQPQRWDELVRPFLEDPRGTGALTRFWAETCGPLLVGYAVGGRPGLVAAKQEAPWLVVNAIDPSRETDPMPGLTLALAGLSLLVILGAAVTANLVARRVIRPVTSASKMANAVADGDLSVRIPVTGKDELAGMSASVNSMADRLTAQIGRLEQVNEAQRQFVSDVAHELRTPTAALLASAEALDDPVARDRAAALVAPQLRRLAGLTEDLLEISRMDAGRAELVTSRIDLADLIDEVVADSGAPDQISYRGPVELQLTTDPARLRVVLRNLVANALQHGAPPVGIAVVANEREVAVSVHDCGAGVPPELRERVFDRFVRGDRTRHGSSSGLGLAIAAENARLFGAHLGLEPDGATFTLRWQVATLDRGGW